MELKYRLSISKREDGSFIAYAVRKLGFIESGLLIPHSVSATGATRQEAEDAAIKQIKKAWGRDTMDTQTREITV